MSGVSVSIIPLCGLSVFFSFLAPLRCSLCPWRSAFLLQYIWLHILLAPRCYFFIWKIMPFFNFEKSAAIIIWILPPPLPVICHPGTSNRCMFQHLISSFVLFHSLSQFSFIRLSHEHEFPGTIFYFTNSLFNGVYCRVSCVSLNLLSQYSQFFFKFLGSPISHFSPHFLIPSWASCLFLPLPLPLCLWRVLQWIKAFWWWLQCLNFLRGIVSFVVLIGNAFKAFISLLCSGTLFCKLLLFCHAVPLLSPITAGRLTINSTCVSTPPQSQENCLYQERSVVCSQEESHSPALCLPEWADCRLLPHVGHHWCPFLLRSWHPGDTACV